MLYLIFCRKLYPELKENLEQFRTHLKESAHEMASLKVWQLQGTVIYYDETMHYDYEILELET